MSATLTRRRSDREWRFARLVHESSFLAYWSLDDPYNLQYGAGGEGDLPNDIKLQFAGLVLRGPAGSRRGRSGRPFPSTTCTLRWPSSCPRVTGLAIALRLPSGRRRWSQRRTAVDDSRAGLRHVRHADRCSSGHRLPGGRPLHLQRLCLADVAGRGPLDDHGPDQNARSFQTVASRVGYFHDPTTDFTLAEPGLYSHRVELTYRGLTSAGPVVEPYPTGDLPGSESGLSHFVVVDPREPPLDVEVSSPMWDADGRRPPRRG